MVVGIAYEVGACFVERDGIERGEDSDVAHLWVGGMGIAVAVYGEVVGHADVNDVVAGVVSDSLCRFGHRLEKVVLIGGFPTVIASFRSSCAVDIHLAVA